MIKIEIKNRWTGSVIFTYEKENATIKQAVLEAVKSGAYLGDAYLGGAYLGGADLGDAYLGGAYLGGADLRDAYLGGAYLGGAYLGDAYLGGADLRDAYLGGAYLGGADLGGADLRDAYLGGAYLGGAYLGGAYLGGADLGGADLRDAKEIDKAYLPIYCKWNTCIIGDNIKIGCKTATIEEWDSFFASDEEYETKRGTEDFKRIEAVYLSYKAYLTHLNS